MRASSRARTMAGSSRSKVGEKARSPNLRKAIVDQARECCLCLPDIVAQWVVQ